MATPDIRIISMYPPDSRGGIKACASVTINGCFAVWGIKVVEDGKGGLFVSMPSRKNQDGYKEVCFPVTAEFREQLHSRVLNAYHQIPVMAQVPAAPQQTAPEQETTDQQMVGV